MWIVLIKKCDKCGAEGNVETIGKVVLRIEHGKKAKYVRFGDLCEDCLQELIKTIKQFFS